jgi:serine/threonine protein phosphatase PrpC
MRRDPDINTLTTRFDTAAASHVGKVRQHNEDSYLTAAPAGIFAVVDGMGGHDAGDLASRTVVEELSHIGVPTSAATLLADCEARITAANTRLKQLASSRGTGLIGTTVAVLLVHDDAFACLWSGDSRIYRIRNSQIEQLSVDHTEAQELVTEGALTPEEAKTWPRRNVITRAIGTSDHPELDIVEGNITSGDTFLICSDGLTTHVADHEILALTAPNTPQYAADRLIELTLARGATDNVTLVITRIANPTPRPPTEITQTDLWR